jgi:hypothetical protein
MPNGTPKACLVLPIVMSDRRNDPQLDRASSEAVAIDQFIWILPIEGYFAPSQKWHSIML